MKFKKYKKKPVIVDVLEFSDGVTKEELDNFITCDKEIYVIPGTNIPYKLFINTLEGDMESNLGDFIVKGVKGEFYSVKKDIFPLTFEEV